MTDDEIAKLVEENLPVFLKSFLKDRENLWIAGGCIRAILNKEDVKDYDLFSMTPGLQRAYFNELSANENVTRTIRTQNAYTVKFDNSPDVQFIHKWTYYTLEETLNAFDFTLSCVGGSYKNGEFRIVSLPGAVDDILNKKIVFRAPNRIEEPTGSLLRVLKFTRLGYTIDAKSLAGVVTKAYEGSKLKYGAELESSGGHLPSTEYEPSYFIHRSIASITGES